MINVGRTTKRKLSGGLLLFTATFLLYSLASPGNLPGDTEVRWSVARQMVRAKGIHLEEDFQTRNYAFGADGKRYSFWGLGQSICLLPLAGIGLALEKVFSIDPDTSDLAAQFFASIILFPMLGAAVVWLFYRLVLLLGYNQPAAIISSLVLAFATMNFHYSASTQEQTQMALLLVPAMLLMVKYHRQRRFVYAWLFCVVLGVCLIFRLSSVLMVFPLYLIAVVTEIFSVDKKIISKTIARWLLAGVLGTGMFVICGLWHNYIRFGSFFESGYSLAKDRIFAGHGLFESAALPTLAAMLFSPGKSIFLYNPVLLLLPVCIWSFYRRHKVIALAAMTVIVSNFIFYSFFITWAGDYAWSIRYQAPLLPLLVLPLVELFNRSLKTAAKAAVISIIAVSVVIQLASVVYNFNLEFVQNPNHHVIPDSYVWDFSQSHLRKRFENIIRHIAGNRDFSSVPVADEEPLLLKVNQSEQSVRQTYYVNFFPFKAKSMLPSSKLFSALLALWLVLVAAFCAVVFKLIRLLQALKDRNVPCSDAGTPRT